jgi:hypothetical protein
MSRGGWVVLAGWGALIVLLAVAQLAFEPEAAEIALLGGSGLVVVGAGLAALVAERRRRGRRAAPGEVLRWTSASSVALAIGICLIVLGWELGAWMIAIGAGVAALGLAGVIRETKAGRP